MWLTGLVAPRHVGSSQTRARTRVPCIGRQILNHCTTREAPKQVFCCPFSAIPSPGTGHLINLQINRPFQKAVPSPRDPGLAQGSSWGRAGRQEPTPGHWQGGSLVGQLHRLPEDADNTQQERGWVSETVSPSYLGNPELRLNEAISNSCAFRHRKRVL